MKGFKSRFTKLFAVASICLATPLTVRAVVAILSPPPSKSVFEKVNYGIDFGNVLTIGDVAIVSVTATDQTTGSDVTAQMIAVSPAPQITSGTAVVAFQVQNGVANRQYLLDVKVSDTGGSGQRFEANLTLTVTPN